MNVGDVSVRIGLDDAPLQSGLAGSKSSLQTIGSSMAGIGKGLTMAVTLPILGAAGASVKFASDLSESLSKSNKVFGDSAGEIESWAGSAAQNLGIAKADALDYASTIGSVLKAVGFEKDVDSMSTSIVQLSSDMASFHNSSPEETFLALRAAVTGEFEPMKKYGVVLNQAAIEQEALTSGLVDSKDQIDAQVKAQAALNIITRQTADLQGDFADTSDGMANSTRILQAQLKDAGASIGAILLPAVTNLAQSLKGLLERFTNLSPGAKTALVVFAGIAAVIPPILVAVGSMISAFGAISGALAGISLAPILAVVAAVVAIVAAFVIAWKKSEAFRDFWIGLWETIKTGVSQAIAFLKSVFAPIGELLMNSFASLKEQIVPALDGFKAAWENLKAAIEPLMPIFQAVGVVIGAIAALVVGVVVGAINGIINAIAPLVDAIGGVLQFVSGVIAGIVALVTGDFEGAWEHFKSALEGAWTAISGVVEAIWNLIKGFVDGIVGFFKSLYDTLVGHSIIPDLVNGILGFFDELKRAALAIVNKLVSDFLSFITSLKLKALELFGGLVDSTVSLILGLADKAIAGAQKLVSGIVDRIDTILPGFREAFGKITGFLADLAGDFMEIGSDIIAGLLKGIRDNVSKVVSFVKGLGTTIKNTVKSILGISSPSKVFAGYGGFLVEGLALGIGRNEKIAIRAAERLADVVGVSASAQLSGGTLSAALAGSDASLPTPISIMVTGNTIAGDYDVDRIAERLVERLRMKGIA